MTFVRHGGDSLIPGEMFTDGGSVPRPFWVFKNFSPWGYGPAFIVHDWLFHMYHCKLPGYDRYSVEEAATIMSEIMKTMMESPGFDYGSKAAVYLMYKAVQTPQARKVWAHGQCVTPSPTRLIEAPDVVFVVEFVPTSNHR